MLKCSGDDDRKKRRKVNPPPKMSAETLVRFSAGIALDRGAGLHASSAYPLLSPCKKEGLAACFSGSGLVPGSRPLEPPGSHRGQCAKRQGSQSPIRLPRFAHCISGWAG